MAVTLENVRGVAALARLELSPEEEERLTGELNRILEYMDKLNELNTEDVTLTAHVVPMANAFRADRAELSPARERILRAAPELEDGYFRVPRVIG
ncbi:MAG: Asp-tRNA(Asn)/Glu-tRNA(Gln) amidotransferase subunit GatC [Candidatus Latescibacteria bacterium]|nr:Asp-tRNA(Asn)/Glu-tRNA(Gln) amidotransferase subunit GatC [Candidatus Latescibacterota bacterium]